MRRRQNRRQSLPLEPITLEIEKLSHEGRGIAHMDGKVTFVEEALPGEQVEAQLSARRDSFNEARTLRILRPSGQRVEPPCEYASVCGGCSLQHFDPAAQLLFKDGVLHEKLQHALGRNDYEHLSPVSGPAFAYRRKARLGVRYVAKKAEMLVGFREKRSTFITRMSHCEILEPGVSDLLPRLAELLGGLQRYRHIPQIEVAMGDPLDNEAQLALVIRHLQPLGDDDQDKLIDFARRHGLALYLQPGGVDSVHRIFPPNGVDRLYYLLPEFGLTMGFHPMDFTQVNAVVNRRMVQTALELLDLQGSDRVLDLFCGLGNFTLPMAAHCQWVCGVEGVEEMVERGYENAAMNGITNVEFHRADLAGNVAGKPWLASPFDKVLLDPPRSGALEIIDNVLALKAGRIVYISCNPATLARDAALLEAGGYTLERAGVLDMFPQTTHVESIALFVRKQNRKGRP